MDERDDAALARAAAGGDDGAFSELVRRHAPCILALCAATAGAAEADDAAQDVFLKAHRSLARFRGDAAVGTWLHRIAVNLCLDRLRAAARRREGPLEGPEPREPSSVAVLEARDLAERLLARLTPEQRVAVLLRERDGLSYEEIAAAMACSLDSVKSRLKRARQELEEAARHFSGPGGV